jgi:hypothetical protein
MNHL